jgi:hypothetical protein
MSIEEGAAGNQGQGRLVGKIGSVTVIACVRFRVFGMAGSKAEAAWAKGDGARSLRSEQREGM